MTSLAHRHASPNMIGYHSYLPRAKTLMEPFRQQPQPKEQLLAPERLHAQNEALARYVDSARRKAFGRNDKYSIAATPDNIQIPWRYVLPIIVGFIVGRMLPTFHVSFERSLLIGLLSALGLFAVAFLQDVIRWIRR
ncbi:MAG TPA: hypothetical protein PLJ27_01200 [Polyangiaceae bacterium]|nr:MAG: hypothetical protein BWY17_01289 [Deltaproteobacteria bacterium ADurb.Bin207]HNS96648.1 hypothetical protein [Polyangiaceae bacterium]HNZ23039.1 hypothetical protein [Polyangiaceae bacterium]HOD21184.1 hypothetical protein [Polyangiaceae bacterium]HOE49052.1 hypothetical protein [Polyangiaceae bacterium]